MSFATVQVCEFFKKMRPRTGTASKEKRKEFELMRVAGGGWVGIVLGSRVLGGVYLALIHVLYVDVEGVVKVE